MFLRTISRTIRPQLSLRALTTPTIRSFSAFTPRLHPEPETKPLATEEKVLTAKQAIEVPDLTALKYEQDLYAQIRVHNRPYLVTEGDVVILPFRMKHAEIGDVLHFTDIETVGSRNYTYHVKEGVDCSAVNISGVVLEKTKNPMTVKEVTKRRNRHVKHLKIKQDLTKIRISQLKLGM